MCILTFMGKKVALYRRIQSILYSLSSLTWLRLSSATEIIVLNLKVVSNMSYMVVVGGGEVELFSEH